MRAGKRTLRLLLVAAASLAASCDRAPPPLSSAGDVSSVRWWEGNYRIGNSDEFARPLDLTRPRKELAALNLAKISAAGADDGTATPDHGRRYTVNVYENEDVMFRGEVYRVNDERSLERLGEALHDLSRDKKIAWMGILYRGDAQSTWGRAAELINIARSSLFRRLDAVHLGANIGVFGTEGRIDADLLPPLSTPDATPAAVDGVDGPTGFAPRVRVGERAWTFPTGDPYAAGASIDAANANWEAIHAALSGSPPGALRLTLSPRAPWAHVAQFLGIALAAGRTDVDLPQVGYAMRLSTQKRGAGPQLDVVPHDERTRPRGERDPRDWPLWLGIGLGVVAAGALVAWGQRRYAPRQRKPSKGGTQSPAT